MLKGKDKMNHRSLISAQANLLVSALRSTYGDELVDQCASSDSRIRNSARKKIAGNLFEPAKGKFDNNWYDLSCYSILVISILGNVNTSDFLNGDAKVSMYGTDGFSSASTKIQSVTPNEVKNIKKLCNAISFGNPDALFPVPEDMFEPLSEFIRTYALISHYFAFGADNLDEEDKVFRSDIIDCGNLFSEIAYIWKIGFQLIGISVDFQPAEILETVEEVAEKELINIGKTLGIDEMVKARFRGIATEDILRGMRRK